MTQAVPDRSARGEDPRPVLLPLCATRTRSAEVRSLQRTAAGNGRDDGNCERHDLEYRRIEWGYPQRGDVCNARWQFGFGVRCGAAPGRSRPDRGRSAASDSTCLRGFNRETLHNRKDRHWRHRMAAAIAGTISVLRNRTQPEIRLIWNADMEL